MIGKLGWGVMTSLALIIAVYAIALLFVPAMRALFLQERFAAVPLAAYLTSLGQGLPSRSGRFSSTPDSAIVFCKSIGGWGART